MRKSAIVSAAMGLILCGPGVAEEDFDPEPIIQGRQAALRDIGASFKAIGDQLKSSSPVMATIVYNAQQIENLVGQQQFWFPQGTGPESDIDTLAKPEIWRFPDEFKAGQDAFSRETRNLTRAAQGADVAAIRAQWREVGKTCKSCHDRFRAEED